MYNKINEKILNSLEKIFGREDILTDKQDKEKYATDETPGAYFPPEAVVFPRKPEQIKELVKLARSLNFPIIPRGGGTSLTGGSLAVCGGVLISFEHLDSILQLDEKNRMAVVQPGVINGKLQEAAQKEDLFYPVNPASQDSCTLGGNVAESTGGANTVKYGTTENYLTGIKAVTGSGQLWTAGGKVVKNSTDRNLMQLMCGSEGTLSIFTELTFRLVENPKKTVWLIIPYRDILDIPKAAGKIFKLGVDPTMVELMDSKTLEFCEKYLDIQIPYSEYHQLLVRLDSLRDTDLDEVLFKIGETCSENSAKDPLVADTRQKQEKIWEFRSAVHDAITHVAGTVLEEDVVVPPANTGQLIQKIREISEDTGMPSVIFGHLGDGNMHLNFTGNPEDIPEEDIYKLKTRIFSAALKLGGKLSGEHGIGVSKKKYFSKFMDPGYIALLKKIKGNFDPDNILNPGKIYED
ncbi:MAG: FAD-binding oxidoreductase [Elusimicrobiota bacterium]